MDVTRRVLFLAYYFPPLGGGGVQRSLAYCRYLPEHGYEPVVVTGPAAREVQWAPVDETLSDRLPEGLRVRRVQGQEPPRAGGWTCRASRWLRFDESFSRWWVAEAARVAYEVVEQADVIYASMSPFETGRVAARLARESGKPWVADLRDPWALDDWLVFPTAVHRRLEFRAMRRTLASASGIVMNTPESTRQLLQQAPELRRTPIVTIPNGYDAGEFATLLPKRAATGPFRIVHAGHVHTRREGRTTRIGRRILGGAVPGLETGTRSHVKLVEALGILFDRRPDLQGRIRVELVGPISAADRAQLPAFVLAHGYLAHSQTIALLRGADLLFLPMHDLAPGARARIVPGKTYEYMAARTPILAAVPEGDARDLLEQVGNASVCAPADVGAMSRAIEWQFDRAARGEPRAEPDLDVLFPFERRVLTGQLAGLFDSILGLPRSSGASPAKPSFRYRPDPVSNSRLEGTP